MKRQKQEKPISDELIDEFLKQGRTADGGGIRSGQFHDMPTLRPSETSSNRTYGSHPPVSLSVSRVIQEMGNAMERIEFAEANCSAKGQRLAQPRAGIEQPTDYEEQLSIISLELC